MTSCTGHTDIYFILRSSVHKKNKLVPVRHGKNNITGMTNKNQRNSIDIKAN